MTAPTYTKTRPAARFVERQVTNLDDQYLFLDMLGLIDEAGGLTPDDNNVYNFPAPDKGPGAKDPNGRATPATDRRDRSTVPPGLRDLPPETTEEAPKKRRGPKPKAKVIRPPKPREIPPCGTYKAYTRHKRRIKLGYDDPSTLDDACLEEGRRYHRDYGRNRQKDREQQRLVDAGVNQESAQVLSELVR